MKPIIPAVLMTIWLVEPAIAWEREPDAFAQKAASSDMFEIAAAKLEIQNGKSDKIKTFANEMLRDHSASTHDLNKAAADEGVQPPVAIDAVHRQKLDAFKPLKGVELDAAYASTQISVHTEADALFDAYSKDGGRAFEGVCSKYVSNDPHAPSSHEGSELG